MVECTLAPDYQQTPYESYPMIVAVKGIVYEPLTQQKLNKQPWIYNYNFMLHLPMVECNSAPDHRQTQQWSYSMWTAQMKA